MNAEHLNIVTEGTEESEKAFKLALALMEEAERYPISVSSAAMEAVGLEDRGQLPDLLAKSKGVLAGLIKYQERP